MKEYSEAFVGFDTAKEKHAVAIAGSGRDGEVHYFGEIDSSPHAVAQFVKQLDTSINRVCQRAGAVDCPRNVTG